MAAGKLVDKITDKYRQPVLNGISNTIHEAALKGDLPAIKKDIEVELSKPDITPEKETYLQGVQQSIAKYEQVLSTVDSPYKAEAAKLYTQADQHAQEVNKHENTLNKVRQDTTLPNASNAVNFVEATLAPTTIDKLRKKHSKNPVAQQVLDNLEKKYKQQEVDTTTPTISSDAAKVVPLVKPTIGKKIEQEFLAEYSLQLGSEAAEGKLDNISGIVKETQLQQVVNSTNVEELNQLQGVKDKDISKAAKNRLNELYKTEDKNVPTNINSLPEYYTNNPVTFLKDKRDLYNINLSTTIEEFSNLIQTPSFQEQFKQKEANKVVEEKVKQKKKDVEEVEQPKVEAKQEKKKSIPGNQQKSKETEIKDVSKESSQVEPEIVEDTSNIFIPSTNQEHQVEEIIPEHKIWQDVNANKLRTGDAVTYSYDDGMFTIPLLGKKLTEEEFKKQYSKADKSKGYHVLYDTNGNVVFHKENLIDVDFIRNLHNRLGDDIYTTPVTLHINGDYKNGSFINSNRKHDDIQIEARIGDKVIGKLPATKAVAKDQQQQFDSLRKQIYEGWKNSDNSEYQYPISTTITKILPGRFWQGVRTTNLNSIGPKVILGLAKNGQLLIPNVKEDVIPAALKEDLQTKYNVVDGNVHW